MSDWNELSEVAKQLNSKSDRVNAIITSANERLAALNIGIETCYEGDSLKSPTRSSLPDETGTCETSWYLAYYFDDDDEKWQLGVREVSFMYNPNGGIIGTEEDWSPLLEASREMRIRAVEQLPALVKKLTSISREAVKSIEKAEAVVGAL